MPRGPPAAPSSSGNDPPPSLKKGTSVSAHMDTTRVVMCREFGHRTPHLRDIRLIINAINNYQQLSINKCVNFSLDEIVKNHKLQITTAFMVRCACVPKSSAKHLVRVEFSQKCFVDLIFGHTFLVHFSKLFRLLCKFESKK